MPTLSFAPGFPAADFRDCGPSVFAYGGRRPMQMPRPTGWSPLIEGHEGDFDGRIYSPDEGVRHAMELAKTRAQADHHRRHPGQSRRRRRFRHDRHAARAGPQQGHPRRHRRDLRSRLGQGRASAGVGATVTLSLGGKSGIPGDAPYQETFVVEKLSDGKFVAPGPYFGGRDMDMGPSACLRIGDVSVVVSSHKAQLADQSMYRYVGIEPTEQAILVNKSSVHFRADFEPIAEKLLICAAPGAMPADTASLPWTRLRPGIRIKPNGPAFAARSQILHSSATG